MHWKPSLYYNSDTIFFPHWPYILFIERRVPVVHRNSTTSTFLFVWFLDESWDHAVWYYSIEATTIKKNQTPMLIYVITILDIALINFIMIVNINSCDFSIIVGVSLVQSYFFFLINSKKSSCHSHRYLWTGPYVAPLFFSFFFFFL